VGNIGAVVTITACKRGGVNAGVRGAILGDGATEISLWGQLFPAAVSRSSPRTAGILLDLYDDTDAEGNDVRNVSAWMHGALIVVDDITDTLTNPLAAYRVGQLCFGGEYSRKIDDIGHIVLAGSSGFET
jgi:hypothetical protein